MCGLRQCLLIAGSKEPIKWQGHNGHRTKLDLTFFPRCWWKIWLFPSSGVGGVSYFERSVFDSRQNKVHENSQMWSGEKSWWMTQWKLTPLCQLPQRLPRSLPRSPVAGCQSCSNAKTALLTSDTNTWILSLVKEEIEEVARWESEALWVNLNVL